MKKISFFAIILLIAWSCRHDTTIPENMTNPTQTTDCDPETVYFVNDIQPLLNSTCATSGCHDNQTAEHGVRLTSYTNIIQTGKVRPFRPDDSKIYKVLFGGGDKGDDIMPPSPQNPLTSAQKKLIYDWIMQGAKNNECLDCNLENVSFAVDVSSIITNNCLSCHSGPSPNGGVSLTNYIEISNIAKSGLLMNVLTASNGAPQMPQSGPLSNCSIDKIQKWINDGYPNN